VLIFLVVIDGFSFGFGWGCLCHPITHCIFVGDLRLRCLSFDISHSSVNIGVFYLKEGVNMIFS
jgi:hypothetical protein